MERGSTLYLVGGRRGFFFQDRIDCPFFLHVFHDERG